jgi:hypothetical protein
MDITPFNETFPDFWASMGSFSYILLGIAAIVLLIGVVSAFSDFPAVTMLALFVAVILGAVSLGSNMESIQKTYKDHYNNAVSELKTALSNDGFKLISGRPDLHPNTKSSMLLSYEDKLFDCIMYSPEDVNTNVVFTCGDTKLSLTEIKEGQK